MWFLTTVQGIFISGFGCCIVLICYMFPKRDYYVCMACTCVLSVDIVLATNQVIHLHYPGSNLGNQMLWYSFLGFLKRTSDVVIVYYTFLLEVLTRLNHKNLNKYLSSVQKILLS